MTEGRYQIRPLDESTWPAFAALVEANGGIFGGCWCIGFHPEAADKNNQGAASHRDLKHARVRAGTAHAALVFHDEECVGWAQFGSCEEVARIKNRAAYEKGRDSALPDWRIGCCFVGKGHRRQGVAAAALAGAIELIGDLGGGSVEGYPEPADAVPSGFLYNGAMSTYERLGFTRTRPIGKHRWVVTREVQPKAASGPSRSV
jgi:GNAT superfamily N-acetyltransferase